MLNKNPIYIMPENNITLECKCCGKNYQLTEKDKGLCFKCENKIKFGGLKKQD